MPNEALRRVTRAGRIIAVATIAACAAPRHSLVAHYVEHASRFAPPEYDELEDIARVRGIPPLRSVALPQGTRELRITDSYPMFAGAPIPTVRIVERDGETRGEIMFFWLDDVAWGIDRPATSCTERVNGRRVCMYLVPPARSPSWKEVATTLDSLGAWTISARCESGSYITDSGQLILQRLDGDRLERYSCNAPSSRTGAAGTRAAALYAYFRGVTEAVAPSR